MNDDRCAELHCAINLCGMTIYWSCSFTSILMKFPDATSRTRSDKNNKLVRIAYDDVMLPLFACYCCNSNRPCIVIQALLYSRRMIHYNSSWCRLALCYCTSSHLYSSLMIHWPVKDPSDNRNFRRSPFRYNLWIDPGTSKYLDFCDH